MSTLEYEGDNVKKSFPFLKKLFFAKYNPIIVY
jgi:hypothetical protein